MSLYVTTVDQAGQESVPSETLTFRPGTENVAENGQASLNLYPIPTHDVLNLNADLQGRTEVMVLDMNSRIVKHYVVNGMNEMRLNVSDLQSGVYFIRVNNETTNAVGKFVIE